MGAITKKSGAISLEARFKRAEIMLENRQLIKDMRDLLKGNSLLVVGHFWQLTEILQEAMLNPENENLSSFEPQYDSFLGTIKKKQNDSIRNNIHKEPYDYAYSILQEIIDFDGAKDNAIKVIQEIREGGHRTKTSLSERNKSDTPDPWSLGTTGRSL